MGHVITLFEHDCTSGFDWKDRDLVVLQRLNRTAGVEMLRPVVTDGKRELRAAQHVGVFRLGNRTVQVLPKIHQSSEKEDAGQRAREATRNLLHMLQIADEVTVREHGMASLLRRDMDWFEILTHMFATHLREEWRRGASRGYLEVEDDLPTLKGKWRIADQISHPGRDHLLAVTYDEFTADIPLNRVFRFVVERLWNCTRSSENRQILGELRQWLDEVTLLPALTLSAATSALLNRLNRRLEPLLNLARLFLDGGAMQMTAGDLTSFAFVFDMNRVFEAFVVNMVRKYRHQILTPVFLKCDLLPQARGVSLYLARTEEKRVFRLKPDLAVRRANTFPLLVDAKYKRLDTMVSDARVAQADFNQMFAYAHRYDCPRVVMLYPQTADMANPFNREFVLEGTNEKTVVAATVDVREDFGTAAGRFRLVERLKTVMMGGAKQ